MGSRIGIRWGASVGIPARTAGRKKEGQPTWTTLTDAHSNVIERQPVQIVAEATHSDWQENVISRGGDPSGWGPLPYYYFVRTD